jgi:hypothetical protein
MEPRLILSGGALFESKDHMAFLTFTTLVVLRGSGTGL